MAHAWHVAAFGRAKKLPPLTKVLPSAAHRRRQAQSWEEQLVIAQKWTAALARQ